MPETYEITIELTEMARGRTSSAYVVERAGREIDRYNFIGNDTDGVLAKREARFRAARDAASRGHELTDAEVTWFVLGPRPRVPRR